MFGNKCRQQTNIKSLDAIFLLTTIFLYLDNLRLGNLINM